MTPLLATRVITNAVALTGDRKYAQKIAEMVKNPLGCSQDNEVLELELRKIFPGLVIQKQENGKGGCYQEKDMYGRTVAPTNRMADFYETSSALTASVRGMFLAYDMFPDRFYDFDINKDKIQWTRPDSMPKQCMKIADGPESPQAYNAANLDEEEHDGSTHDFHTLIHWRADFSCCLPGYYPTNKSKVKKK